MIDIIGLLRDFAAQKGWAFINGIDAYANYEIDERDIMPRERIFVVDLNISPSFAIGGAFSGATFSGLLMLGLRDDDTGEVASLDETQSEKYQSRLKNLTEELILGIGQFSCKNELEITAATSRLQLNKFDANVDFVAMDITFSTL